MRLRLETTERAPFWLVGDPALNERTEASQILTAGIQITRNQQLISGAEWEAQSAFDRKNQKVVISAESHRKFADEAARMDFLQALAPADAEESLHLWEGSVYLRIDTTGEDFREWPLHGAVVALTGTRFDGAVGLHLTYQVTAGSLGGALTTSVSRPLFRCNLAGAEVSMTVDEMNTSATAAGLTTGDWLTFALVDSDGLPFTFTFEIGDYGVTLPFTHTSLVIIDAAIEVAFTALGWDASSYVYEGSGGSAFFTLTAPGEGGECYAAFSFGRGGTTFFTLEQHGNEDLLPLSLLPDGDLLSMTVVL